MGDRFRRRSRFGAWNCLRGGAVCTDVALEFNRTGGSVLFSLVAHSTQGIIQPETLWIAGPSCSEGDVS